MDEETVNRCGRCDMRAPAGKKFCAACARSMAPEAALEDLSRGRGSAAASPSGQPGALTGKQIAVWSVVLGSIAALFVMRSACSDLRSSSRPQPAAAGTQPDPAPPTEPDRAALRAQYERQYASATPEARANAVHGCIITSRCPQAQLDGIIGAGATEREREALRRRSHALGAYATAQGAIDGSVLSVAPLAGVALHIAECGTSDILHLDRTTYGDAAKDIAASRGKAIRASGTIMQIRREGNMHEGTMLASHGFVYFVVAGETKGIVVDSRAELIGVVGQRYDYPNLAGGTTESIVVIGRFARQADSDPPLPVASQPERGAAQSSVRSGPRTADPRDAVVGSRPTPTWDLPFPPPTGLPPDAASQQAAPPSPEARPNDDGVLAARPAPPPATPVPDLAPSASAQAP